MDNETFQKAWRILERFGSLEEMTSLGLSRRQTLQIARLFTFTQTIRPNLPKDLLETFKCRYFVGGKREWNGEVEGIEFFAMEGSLKPIY